MACINIDGKLIGDDRPTFIVAEIGANHNGDVELARSSIDAAAECGVDAVKFQIYEGTELVSDYDRIITWGKPGRQISEKIGDMFDRISLPYKKYKDLFAYAKGQGLIAFSSPFSLKGLDYLLNDLKTSCIKIASSDISYTDLLIESAKSKKPIMLSLGKSTMAEADNAISIIMNNGCNDLVIMHCVAQYPSPIEEMNLRVINSLKTIYPECVVGFSDHSLGITAALGAVVLGARVVEKHFTLDKNLEGPDHWFSMNPDEMKMLVTEIKKMENALGHPRKRVFECEKDEKHISTRSLVLAKDVKAGDVIQIDHLKVVRPGYGINPYDREKIIGLIINKSLKEDTVLEWKYFKHI